MTPLETDYLIVGAGAAGMAFADEILTHTDAEVLLVDRRARPGGHWNDAYPFVRLHLPSSVYGVNSRRLGSDSLDEHGPNAGMYERASGAEVQQYYAEVWQQFSATGRAVFLGAHEVHDGADRPRVTSALTGEVREVVVRRKLVDAAYLETSVPATHQRTFSVDREVRCIPVGELAEVHDPPGRYVVLGAGKTGIDACIWLLEHDVPPERIRWVRPRDPWLLRRSGWQPLQLLPAAMEGLSLEMEAVARSSSVDELFARLEDCGRLARIDPTVAPEMYHCATVDDYELEQLRRIEDVVRLGRVLHLAADRMQCERGTAAADADDLYVDCSAYGLRRPPVRPVFEEGRITIQQIRACAPVFNAALIGYVESSRTDLVEQNRLCPPSRYPDAPADWLQVLGSTMLATSAWRHHPDLLRWLESARVNLLRGIAAQAGDARMATAVQRYGENLRPAMDRLREMSVPHQASAPGEERPARLG